MAKKQKHTILRVRKVNMTDRDRLSVQIIPDKKKKQSKLKCRKRVEE